MTTTHTPIIAPRPTATQQQQAAIAVELIEKRAAEHRLEKDERVRKMPKPTEALSQATGYADGDDLDGLASLARIEGKAKIERMLALALTGLSDSDRHRELKGIGYDVGLDMKEKLLELAQANPEVPEGQTVTTFLNYTCKNRVVFKELLGEVFPVARGLEEKQKIKIRSIKDTLDRAYEKIWNMSQVDRIISTNGLISRNFQSSATAASSRLNYRLSNNHDEAMSSKAASNAEREAAENWQLRSA